MDANIRTIMHGLENLTAMVTRELDSVQQTLGRVDTRLGRMEDRLEAVESRLSAFAAAAAANTLLDNSAAALHPSLDNDPYGDAVATDNGGEGSSANVSQTGILLMVPEGGRQADMWKLQGCALLLARGELLSRESSGNSVGGLSSLNTNQLSSPTPSQCQRSHWKTHRAGCKAKRVAARFVDSILYLVVARGYAANVLPALRLCRDTW